MAEDFGRDVGAGNEKDDGFSGEGCADSEEDRSSGAGGFGQDVLFKKQAGDGAEHLLV